MFYYWPILNKFCSFSDGDGNGSRWREGLKMTRLQAGIGAQSVQGGIGASVFIKAPLRVCRMLFTEDFFNKVVFRALKVYQAWYNDHIRPTAWFYVIVGRASR